MLFSKNVIPNLGVLCRGRQPEFWQVTFIFRGQSLKAFPHFNDELYLAFPQGPVLRNCVQCITYKLLSISWVLTKLYFTVMYYSRLVTALALWVCCYNAWETLLLRPHVIQLFTCEIVCVHASLHTPCHCAHASVHMRKGQGLAG